MVHQAFSLQMSCGKSFSKQVSIVLQLILIIRNK